MGNGYVGKVLKVNLTIGTIVEESPQEEIYRRYLGGTGFVAYYLLTECQRGIDALDPSNVLVFATGVITGVPIIGCGRHTVGAKSPLTGGFGESQAGGYWGTELKAAGYDAVVVTGEAEKPVYLFIQDGKAEIRDARHLWGKTTGETQDILREELGDLGVKVAQIGPAGEKMVRFACVVNDLDAVAGRTGMGAVMGSKKLKAVAVRGHNRFAVADEAGVKAFGQTLREGVDASPMARYLQELGTASGVGVLQRVGLLPTRNFQASVFEGAAQITGEVMRDTIGAGKSSCFACSIRCKRVVKVEDEYHVEPRYGGPEYETIAALGSNCGVNDIKAVAKANEYCNAYGLDTISAGAVVAFAMECYERGILKPSDVNGLQLTFGNAKAMLETLQYIVEREGFGSLLGEGVARAARHLGKGSEEFALHVKGQEIPMHEPRGKHGLGLGYALSPTGADHCHNIQDAGYQRKGSSLESLKPLGILEPLAYSDLSSAKVRMVTYFTAWMEVLNSLVYCMNIPVTINQVTELVRLTTGWNTSLWELMKTGERVLTMARSFNVREGFTAADDRLPARFFTGLPGGPLQGVAVDAKKLSEAMVLYYQMMGWGNDGVPTTWKLAELDIPWVHIS